MIIHRYWTGDDDPPFPAWGTMITAANPEHELRDHTDTTLPDHIRKTADEAEDWVPKEWAHRHRANIVRIGLLQTYGGFWLDHDILPLVPLADIPFPATAAHDRGHRCNSYLAFEADDPVLEQVLDYAMAFPDDTERRRDRVGFISGEDIFEQFCGDDYARVPMLFTSYGMIRPEVPYLLHLFNHRLHRTHTPVRS